MQWVGHEICPKGMQSNMDGFINKLFVAVYMPLTSLTNHININYSYKVTSFITLLSSLTLFLIIYNNAVNCIVYFFLNFNGLNM